MHAIGDGTRLQLRERLGEVGADPLERKDVDPRHECGEAVVGIEPQRLATPDDAVDDKAAQRQRATVHAHRVDSAIGDPRDVRGVAGEEWDARRTAMSFPIAHKERPRRHRRPSFDRECSCRVPNDRRISTARQHGNPHHGGIAAQLDVGIDRDEAVALPARAETHRCQVAAQVERNVYRQGCPSVDDPYLGAELLPLGSGAKPISLRPHPAFDQREQDRGRVVDDARRGRP